MDLRVMERLSNAVSVVDALIECLHIKLLTLLVVMDDLSGTPSMVLIRDPHHHVVPAIYSSIHKYISTYIHTYMYKYRYTNIKYYMLLS